MKKAAWKKRIKASCEQAGTYREYFDDVIDTLADVLGKRDDVDAEYREKGAQPLIEYTNKGGATNLTRNPALILWDELNKSALAYWRDLGLTPKGLRAIDEGALKKKKKTGLMEALSELGG